MLPVQVECLYYCYCMLLMERCVLQETLLAAVEARVLNIDTSDLGGNNTLTRAATRLCIQTSVVNM